MKNKITRVPRSDEHSKNISIAKTGVKRDPFSESHHKHMSEAATRRWKWDADKIERLIQLREKGLTYIEIGEYMGIAATTAQKNYIKYKNKNEK